MGASPDLRRRRRRQLRARRRRSRAERLRRRRRRDHDGRGRRHRGLLRALPRRRAEGQRRGPRRGPRSVQALDPRVDQPPARAGARLHRRARTAADLRVRRRSSTTKTTCSHASRRSRRRSSPKPTRSRPRPRATRRSTPSTKSVTEQLAGEFEGRGSEIKAAVRSLTKKLVRKRIVEEGVRIDGRGIADIRPLSAESTSSR